MSPLFPVPIVSYEESYGDALSRSVAEMVLQGDDENETEISRPLTDVLAESPQEALCTTAQLSQSVAETAWKEQANENSTSGQLSTTSPKGSYLDVVTHSEVKTRKEKSESPVQEEKSSCSRFRVIPHAHQGHIHALLRLRKGFVSGGQDGCLKKWSFEGQLLKRVYEPDGYPHWVTALGTFDSTTWFSGAGNGWVQQWDKNDKFKKAIRPPEFSRVFSEKVINSKRVTCFLPMGNGEGFFCGRPGCFTRHTAEGEAAGQVFMHSQDWVNAMQSAKDGSLIVATGPELAHLRPRTDRDGYLCRVLISQKDDPTEKDRYHLFISALAPIASNDSHFGVGLINGCLKIYDLACKKIVSQTVAHSNRIWAIENISQNVFASCSDDGLIKLWDSRRPRKPFLTLQEQEKGRPRVSVLLRISDTQFVSGSFWSGSNDHPTEDAQLSFWDFRKS
jgi:WD40 repeat protein